MREQMPDSNLPADFFIFEVRKIFDHAVVEREFSLLHKDENVVRDECLGY